MELSGTSIRFFYIFSKESFSYISGKGNPEKVPYISGNETFLYFTTPKPRQNSLYFNKQNFLIFQET